MTAQSTDDYDPDDPVEILWGLPVRFHVQFWPSMTLPWRMPGGRRDTGSCTAWYGCGG